MPDKSMIHRRILREYEKLRDISRERLELKKKRAYELCPELEEMERKKGSLGVSLARGVLGNPEDAAAYAERLAAEARNLEREKKRLLAEAGLPENYLEPEFQCPKCRDTGYIGRERCSCFAQKLVTALYGQAGLSDANENFSAFDLEFYSDIKDPAEGISPRENIMRILGVSMGFVREFGSVFSNLLFYGGTGLGKTFLCSAVARDLLDAGHTVLYVTASRLFRTIEEERFNRNYEEEMSTWLTDIMSVDLLIIDDLGTEFPTVLSAAELFNIINSRLLEKRPVIISTNLSAKDLTEHYSDRIVSRLFGYYTLLHFFGEDIRPKKKLAAM